MSLRTGILIEVMQSTMKISSLVFGILALYPALATWLPAAIYGITFQ
ncbi:MAG: hypothetical protein WD767_19345 [Alphaproteobacteria bacterium]